MIKRVANADVKAEEDSESIAAQPAQCGVGGVKSDALTAYLRKSNDLFREGVLTPVSALSKSVCNIRDIVSAMPYGSAGVQALGEYRKDLEQTLGKLADDVQEVHRKAKSIKGRHAVQLRKVTRKLANKKASADQAPVKKPKSAARQASALESGQNPH